LADVIVDGVSVGCLREQHASGDDRQQTPHRDER
jgi:hypothetical protein